jgi:CRP-like cAMP-binding protein
MATVTEALSRVPLFSGLDKRDLKQLAACMTERAFSEGTPVMTERESAIGFFVITEGSATVSTGGEIKQQLREGDYFGEMALIEGTTRIATVTAKSDLRCLVMTAWNFRPFVRDHPDVAWALLETLVRRIREERHDGTKPASA